MPENARLFARERELPDGNAQTSRDVHVPVVLHNPARLLKLAVNLLACLLFGSHKSLPMCGFRGQRREREPN